MSVKLGKRGSTSCDDDDDDDHNDCDDDHNDCDDDDNDNNVDDRSNCDDDDGDDDDHNHTSIESTPLLSLIIATGIFMSDSLAMDAWTSSSHNSFIVSIDRYSRHCCCNDDNDDDDDE